MVFLLPLNTAVLVDPPEACLVEGSPLAQWYSPCPPPRCHMATRLAFRRASSPAPGFTRRLAGARWHAETDRLPPKPSAGGHCPIFDHPKGGPEATLPAYSCSQRTNRHYERKRADAGETLVFVDLTSKYQRAQHPARLREWSCKRW